MTFPDRVIPFHPDTDIDKMCYNVNICRDSTTNLNAVTLQNNYRMFLCDGCYHAFNIKQYCGYCYSIFQTDLITDDKQWVECETPNCSR